MKVNITARPYFSLENKSIEFANKKYKDLKPSIAKILEEYNINGSSGATANIAGMESTANIKSVDSITTITNNILLQTKFYLCG